MTMNSRPHGGAGNRRYRQVQAAMVAELCSPNTGVEVRGAQLGAVLAFSRVARDTQGGILFEFSGTATAQWVVRALAAPRHVQIIAGRVSNLIGLRVARRDLLVRFGYHPDGRWAFGSFAGGGRDSALGAVRGALAAKGHLRGDGLFIGCRDTVDAVKIVALMDRVGIRADRLNPGGREVSIGSSHVTLALVALGLPVTAQRYEAVLNSEPPVVRESTPAVPPVPFALANRSKALIAAETESRRIAALGDLDAYGVLASLRQAAEIRRDRPDLTYSQAAALAGVTKDAFATRIRRFWKAIGAREIPAAVGARP